MSVEPSDGQILAMFIVGTAMVMLVGIGIGVSRYDNDGMKGHDCFANNTCRAGLVCLHGDGHEPGTCVATSDGGVR